MGPHRVMSVVSIQNNKHGEVGEVKRFVKSSYKTKKLELEQVSYQKDDI